MVKKSFAAAVALFCLLAIFAHAEEKKALCIVTDQVVALVDESGEEILAASQFADIFCVSEQGVYAAGETGKYHLYNAEGVQIYEGEISMARESDGIIIFRQDGLYGAMSMNGAILEVPVWSQLVTNGEGGYLALDGYPMDDVPDEVIYIAPDGEVAWTGIFTANGLQDVSDGRMPYMASDGRYGYLDAHGDVALASSWLYAGAYLNGVAQVSGEDGMGLIDGEGDLVLQATHAYLEFGDDLIAALTGDGTLCVYSADGQEERFSLEVDGAEVAVVQNCVAVMDAAETRLYDASGACILTAAAGATFAPGLNGQIIASDGEWGEACQWLVNPDGSAASERYQRILPLAGDCYAFLTMTGANYYSDELGSMQTSWDYNSVRYGMLDGEGKEILPAEYLEILGLGSDRFLLIADQAVYLTDADGNALRTWFTVESESASSEADA